MSGAADMLHVDPMRTDVSGDLERPHHTGYTGGRRRSAQPFTGMAEPGEFGDERGLPILVASQMHEHGTYTLEMSAAETGLYEHPMDRARRARKAPAAIVSRGGRDVSPAGPGQLSRHEPSPRSPRALSSTDPALLCISDRELRARAHRAAGPRHRTRNSQVKGEQYLSPRKVPIVAPSSQPPASEQQHAPLDAARGPPVEGDAASTGGHLASAASPHASSSSAVPGYQAPPLTPRGMERHLPPVGVSSEELPAGHSAGHAGVTTPRRQPHATPRFAPPLRPDPSPPRREPICTQGLFLATRRTERFGLQTSRSVSRAALRDPTRPSVFHWPPEETVASAAYLLALARPERPGRHGSRDPSKAFLHQVAPPPEIPQWRLPARGVLSQAVCKRHGLEPQPLPAATARELQAIRDGASPATVKATAAGSSVAATARWRESTIGDLRAAHEELLASCRSLRGEARPTVFVVHETPTPRREAHPSGVWRGTPATEIRTRQRMAKNGDCGLPTSCDLTGE